MAGGNKDWIPIAVEAFDTFQTTFCSEIGANISAWHITTGKNTILQGLHTTYAAYYAISKLTATARQIDYDNTETARVALIAYIRKITKEEVKNNTLIPDENRTEIGVPNAPKSKTKSVASEVAPAVGYTNKATLVGKYKFTPRKKPVGQASFRIKTGFYLLGGPIPTEKQCTQTDVINSGKDVIVYDAENLGMSFVSYTRYLTGDKKLGKAATRYLGIIS